MSKKETFSNLFTCNVAKIAQWWSTAFTDEKRKRIRDVFSLPSLPEPDMHIMDMEKTKAIAEVKRFWSGEDTLITVRGITYKINSDKQTRNAYIIESDGAVLACAKYAKSFYLVSIEHAGSHYTLLNGSHSSEELVLSEGGTRIGSFSLFGYYSHYASMDFPEDLPLPVQAFVINFAVQWYYDSMIY